MLFQNGSYTQVRNNEIPARDTVSLCPSPKINHSFLRLDLPPSCVGRPSSMITYPSITAGHLNVSNPRYAAKYGNPYLRDSIAPYFPPPPPPPYPQPHPSPMIARSPQSRAKQLHYDCGEMNNTQVPTFSVLPHTVSEVTGQHSLAGISTDHYIHAQDMLHTGRLATHV